MSTPDASSSLLFGLVGNHARIRRRRSGGYRLSIAGIDDIRWFTDRPLRKEGAWSPEELVDQWGSMFGLDEPNAQLSFTASGKRELITFEMGNPRWTSKNNKLSFGIDPVGDISKDLVTGLRQKRLNDPSLFIDDDVTATGGLTLDYSAVGDNLVVDFTIENPSTDGWAGLVFNEFIFPSDGIFISWTGTDSVYAYDTYNPGIPTLDFFPNPALDNNPVFLTPGLASPPNNQLNVELISSSYENGVLSVQVMRPLVTGDLFDLQIEAEAQYRALAGSGEGSFQPGIVSPGPLQQDFTGFVIVV